MNDKRVVWILGAGFSRSVGGPLLPELFTKNSLEVALAKYGPQLGPSARLAAHIFHYGRAFPEGLHGSVDWKREGKDGVKQVERTDFAVHGNMENLVIASPGPTKASISGVLTPLWERAKTALTGADAIVFVGYRFPESDATARSELLGAIKENGVRARRHVVLGPDVAHRDVRRLEGLLRYTVPSSSIENYTHVHPMFAEDFLSVVPRSSLVA